MGYSAEWLSELPNANETAGGISKFRMRLHGLGFHVWSKWSDVRMALFKPYQTRRCVVCNKTQIRFIVAQR